MNRESSNSPQGSKSGRGRSSKRGSTPSPHNLKKVEDFIRDNSISVFSKSWCPFCTLAKDIFTQRNLEFGIMELDLDEDGADLQKALVVLTGQKTVPNIFINQKHIGGYENLFQIAESGTLEDICKGISMDFDYDLFVIGGGSGGLAAAKEAASFGKKVALCDFVVPSPLGTKWGLGGTCVNVGCIPKKLMHRAGNIHRDLLDAEDFGWQRKPTGSSVKHDWEKLVDRVQEYIKSLNFGSRVALSEKDVKYFNAFGSFIDKHCVKLVDSKNEETTVTAKNIIIAVGARPKYPNVKGDREYCITSDDLFSMRCPPGRTLIVGGSYIATECAGFLASLGYSVTVMTRSIVLRGFDRQMVDRIEAQLQVLGVKFIKNCIPGAIEKDRSGKGILVKGETNGKKVFASMFDTVILAIGRSPCTDKLNLDEIGVQLHVTNRKIIIAPDDRTSVSNIFAIGDVADGVPELTPVAIHAGKLLVRRLYNFKYEMMDYRYIPTSIFAPREYACVGYTEQDAIRDLGEHNVEVYLQEFTDLESVLSSNKTQPKNLAKMITRKVNKKEIVIGLHLSSPNASEIIQGFTLAIKLGATKYDFANLISIHPTVAEVFTMLNIPKSSGQVVSAAGC